MPVTKLREQTSPTGLTLFGPLPEARDFYLMWNGPGGRLNLAIRPFDSDGSLVSIEHITANNTYNTRAEARAAAKAFTEANTDV